MLRPSCTRISGGVHPRVRRLLFAPVVVLAVLSLAEGVARVVMRKGALVSVPEEMVRSHLQGGGADLVYDPILGWRRSQLPNWGLGVDQYGFRDADTRLEKAPGTLRGFALGDSQTFGAGIEADEAYAAVAERLLRERGHNVEIINAGLAGYRSIQALRLIQTTLPPFDPDFVVVDCQGQDSPHDEMPSQDSGIRGALQRGLFYSRLYRTARIGVEQASARLGGAEKRNLALPDLALPSPFPQRDRPGNHDLILAWGQSHDIEVFFLDYPFGDATARALLGTDDLPTGARLVATVPALRASGLPVPELFLDKNHLTAKGAAVVGGQLADVMEPWVVEQSSR